MLQWLFWKQMRRLAWMSDLRTEIVSPLQIVTDPDYTRENMVFNIILSTGRSCLLQE